MEHGCAVPLAELKRLWPSVVTKNIEEQATYADAVCRANASDSTWNTAMLQNIRSKFPLAPPNNTTGVGNLAYMALNAPEEHKTEWQNIHLAYTLFLKRQLKL